MPVSEGTLKSKLTEGLNANFVNNMGGEDGLARNRVLILLASLLLRWCVALNSYSGAGTPPMFGDYEAHRHWMEITRNLPVKQWYRNGTGNDLQYWGLDYPPLSAYHSYAWSSVIRHFLPESLELGSSGYESETLKFLMRCSVAGTDMLYQVVLFFYFPGNALALAFFYPGQILIDYGHFQYNCASTGLFTAAVMALCYNSHILASILFTMALNFKQMELYHALPFFFFYLGSFIKNPRRLVLISFSVLLTFTLIWWPFLPYDASFVLRRVFPVERGLFEDKVANFWCSLNILYKITKLHDSRILFRVCAMFTLCAVAPSSWHLFQYPKPINFILACVNSSLAFFLFSFHVHEKSILLAASAVSFYAIYEPFVSFWFLSISTFSMLPLLTRDGLFLPYSASSTIYWLCFHHLCPARINKLFLASAMGCVILSLALKFVPNPQRYPHLWPLLVSLYSFGHFLSFFFYFNWKQLIIHRSPPLR